jgi:FkbM family methyltransferase
MRIGGITIPTDLAIEFHRYIFYGIYESEFIAHLRSVLRPGDVFLDPGTNIGYISAVAAELVGDTGKVISLEPSRTCFKQLESYLDAPNITLLNCALHNRTGKAWFYDTPRVLERGFACLADVEEPTDGVGYQVEVSTVDDLCERYSIDAVRYLKLDVEGAELMALQGATRKLAAAKIDFVLVETDFAAAVTADIDQLLRSYGYAPFRADNAGRLHPIRAADQKGRFDVVWKCVSA